MLSQPKLDAAEDTSQWHVDLRFHNRYLDAIVAAFEQVLSNNGPHWVLKIVMFALP